MLAMITSVCNMSCAHCCMSCGKNLKGEHMSEAVYARTLEFSAQYGHPLVLSGGEPTLHPQFKQYLVRAIRQTQINGDGQVWLATNGSKTKTTEWLLEYGNEVDWDQGSELLDYAEEIGYPLVYSDEGYFEVSLSTDDFHDKHMVAPHIRAAFERVKSTRTGEGTRNVTDGVVQAGHYSGASKRGQSCCCSTTQIKPNGDVFLCGCDNAPRIGNVLEHWDIDLEALHSVYPDCINMPETDMDDDYEVANHAAILEKHAGKEHYLNRQWAADNIKIKRGKEGHPDTHRISLDQQPERLSEYKEAVNL